MFYFPDPISLTKKYIYSKIKIGNGETTNVVSRVCCKKTHLHCQIQMCFFYAYLFNIKTKIVKMITTIVSVIKPNKRRLIIAINTTSAISTTSILVTLSSGLKAANTHLLILNFLQRNYIDNHKLSQHKKRIFR